MQATGTTATANTGIVDYILGAQVETLVVLVICLVLSLASWYVIAVKWWEFRRLRGRRDAFEEAMRRTRSMDERVQAVAALEESPYADMVRATAGFLGDLRDAMQKQGVDRTGLSLTQLEALTLTLETEVGEEVDNAGRMVPLLATVAAAAPLLGLLGTVIGIMRSFIGIVQQGGGNIAAVAPGIAGALLATAAGLLAAIPAVVAYNIYTSRSHRLEGELERLAQEIIGTLGREGRL